MAKHANCSNNGARKMGFEGRDGREYSGSGFVEIPKVFAMQDEFFI